MMLMINSLISRNPFKNWITLAIKQILSWLIMNPKQRFNMATKKVVSILNEVRKSMLDFYTYHETIFKLTKNCKPERLVKMPWSYSKHSKSVENQYNEQLDTQDARD